MSKQLPSFQQYQLAFTARLRDPRHQPVPAGVAPERMAVYDEIVFNNLLESVSACFPVARKTTGKTAWLKLIRKFLQTHSADSPLFRKVPEEFLTFLQHTDLALAPYLQALCHYEWIELYLSSIPTQSHQDVDVHGDIAQQPLVFTQAMQLLHYDYAVHKISPKSKRQYKAATYLEPTYLLVHRDENDKIKFIELNPVTFKLITLVKSGELAAAQALNMLADELNHPQPQMIMQFGLGVLQELKQQGVILGTKFKSQI